MGFRWILVRSRGNIFRVRVPYFEFMALSLIFQKCWVYYKAYYKGPFGHRIILFYIAIKSPPKCHPQYKKIDLDIIGLILIL